MLWEYLQSERQQRHHLGGPSHGTVVRGAGALLVLGLVMWAELLTPLNSFNLQSRLYNVHFLYNSVKGKGHNINKTFNCAWHIEELKWRVL